MSLTQKIVVQTSNVLVKEKQQAEDYVIEQGFDSLQAALRFLIKRLAQHQIRFDLSGGLVSADVEAQIGNSLKDIKRGRVFDYKGNLDELLDQV